MIIGKVIDQLIATQKAAALDGQRLLLIQPLSLDGKEQGDSFLAIDGADAGIGDRVLVTQEGWSAMHVLGRFFSPVDAAVIGIVDHLDLAGPSGTESQCSS